MRILSQGFGILSTINTLILLIHSVSDAAWTTALTSNIDDTTFHYYSDVWFNSTPFNTQFSATKNALFESYSTVFVEKVRITMDGTTGKTCGSSCTFTFSLPEAYSGRFTLMELVTTEGGIDMVDDREISWVRSFPVSSLSPSYPCPFSSSDEHKRQLFQVPRLFQQLLRLVRHLLLLRLFPFLSSP
jgi:hypothetical protein